MPGTLYVVATPIGNLEDVTLRALRVLRDVQLIAAEDTRRTAKLLSHYSITTPTTSLHEHNEVAKTARLIDRLRAGDNIALVSDAGTPLISDPGVHLVSAARTAGIPVIAVPGASALLTALAASGLNADTFVFLGFPPRKASALTRWVEDRFVPPHPVSVFYEAPHRVRLTLEAMLTLLGDRPILVARELTKLHEESVIQPISAHLVGLTEPKGEFTLVVPAAEVQSGGSEPALSEQELLDEVGRLMESRGVTRREAARAIAERFGLTPNSVYRRVSSKAHRDT